MKITKYLLFFILFLVLSSFCYAVKPTQPTTAQLLGLQIAYPEFEYYSYNINPITFNFHVFNSSNVWLTNSTCQCIIHIYNLSGNHKIIANLTYDSEDKDFNYILNTSYITKRQTITYIVYCNTSTEAGYLGNGVYFNYYGNNETFNINYLSIVVCLIGICFILIFVSNNLDERHGILKLLLLSFIVLFFIVFGVIMLTMMRGGDLDINSLLVFKTTTWLLRIFFAYLLIFLLVVIFDKLGMLAGIKNFMRMK